MNKKTGEIKVDGELTTTEFIGLDIDKMPTEYAELSMFKSIPVVFILGYQLGLGNLIKTLGVKVKRMRQVPPNLSQPPCYSFSDESILVPKHHKARLYGVSWS